MVSEMYCLELLAWVTCQGDNASDPHKNKSRGYKLYNIKTKLGHQMGHLEWADKDGDVLNTAFVGPHTHNYPQSRTPIRGTAISIIKMKKKIGALDLKFSPSYNFGL